MHSWHTDGIFKIAENYSPVQLRHGDRDPGLVWVRDARPLNDLEVPLKQNNIRAEIVRCHERGRIDEVGRFRTPITSNKCQKWKEELGTHFGRGCS